METHHSLNILRRESSLSGNASLDFSWSAGTTYSSLRDSDALNSH